MCYGITNSGDGVFSRTGAFNFVKTEILKLPKNVLINREFVMSFFKEDGDQMFLIRPEDETRALGSALRLEELNKDYFEAKTARRFLEASEILQSILVTLNRAMKNPAENFVK